MFKKRRKFDLIEGGAAEEWDPLGADLDLSSVVSTSTVAR